MIKAEDVFTALYEAFHKLESIHAPIVPSEDADNIQLDIYKEKFKEAQKDVEKILLYGSDLLDKYVDNRIKRTIAKMKYNGELK